MSDDDPVREGDPASQERETSTAEQIPLPGGNFRLFVQKLGYQSLISMGLIENPLTRTRDQNQIQSAKLGSFHCRFQKMVGLRLTGA